MRILFSLATAAALVLAQDEIRLIRSQSGPGGRISGSRFIFEETRSRFVYPQDKSFAVYFEWDAPPGVHTLVALWKSPDGRTFSISPDVKMESASRELNCVWTYEIADHMPSGVWTAEVRIDGRPAGSHAFELAIPAKVPAPAAGPAAPALPTLDEIYRTAGASVVTIHKLDPIGRRYDSTLGFVIGRDAIATAFQSIDGAEALEVEFPDGARRPTKEVLAWSRVQDWAIIAAATGNVKSLQRGDPARIAVGQRLIVFNVEANAARVIGGVDISGRRNLPLYGERIQLSPSPAAEAVGGPLLDEHGAAVGILGGTLTPGSRVDRVQMSISPALWQAINAQVAAVPLPALPEKFGSRTALDGLAIDGAMTARLDAMPEFSYGGAMREISKRPETPNAPDTSQFSRRDRNVFIYALMQRKDRRSKGLFSGRIYDAQNRLRVSVPPKKVSLTDVPTRISFGFAPSTLEAGTYRVDLLWDDRAFWRTWIAVTD